MLNAIEPGSVVPIHRHQKTSETVVVLRGRVAEEYYDDLERICCATYELPAGQWHTLRALESGTVIVEFKDRAYEPISPADILSMLFRGVGCASCYNVNGLL